MASSRAGCGNQLKEDLESGRTTHRMYRLHEGLLWSQKRVVIPNDMQLKAKILKELHDGHGGQKLTLLAIKIYFMRPRMEEEIIDYVHTCKVCLMVKTRRGKTLGLLQQMLIPARPWDMINMDFIVDLPPSKDTTY